MSSESQRTSTNTGNPSSTYRVNYSEYVADITGGSPKTARRYPAAAGIGHHINPSSNRQPNRTNPSTQQSGTMPQYGGGTEKCARCLKTVYLAEKKIGASRPYHSSCFNCHTCKRKLDASTFSEHKGEIYCKSCYTRQFGPHGLASGVAMSTEKSAIREQHHVRRSSYDDELDSAHSSYERMRQRTSSSENIFLNDYDSRKTDKVSGRYTRQEDASSERNSASDKKDNRSDAKFDIKYQRSTTPTSTDRVIESSSSSTSQRSTYIEEDDRRKYIHEGEKLSYGSGTSNLVDIPIITTSKKPDSVFNQMETPVDPTRDNRQSQSSSTASRDSYQRLNSREEQSSFTDDRSHSYINTDNFYPNARKSSNDNIVSEDPRIAGNYYYSSSSYESRYQSNMSNSTGRRSPSPMNNNRDGSGLNEFMIKTNLAGNTSSPPNNQYSAIGSLIASSRQRNTQNNDDDDFGH